MFALFRLVAGRRILVLVLLAALAAAGTPAVRAGASRLLACGVSLDVGGLFGPSRASVIDAVSGGILRSSPQRCLREAMRTTAAARTWMQRRSRAQ
jgi:hypothetical protein